MSDEDSSLEELAKRFPVGAALLNVGVDVIEVDRVQKVYERQKDRFLKRVFTKEEQAAIGEKFSKVRTTVKREFLFSSSLV